MLNLFLQTYMDLFFIIFSIFISLFICGTYLIFRMQTRINISPQIQSEKILKSHEPITDYSAISGHDIEETQLDLARAYLEASKPDLAKRILQRLLANPNLKCQREAKLLLEQL